MGAVNRFSVNLTVLVVQSKRLQVFFFCNRICDTWNALPHTVVEAPSLNTFKRLLNNVAVRHVAVLP